MLRFAPSRDDARRSLTLTLRTLSLASSSRSPTSELSIPRTKSSYFCCNSRTALDDRDGDGASPGFRTCNVGKAFSFFYCRKQTLLVRIILVIGSQFSKHYK